ncbi:phospholipid-transporting ATPase ID [Ciona intestinalis]
MRSWNCFKSQQIEEQRKLIANDHEYNSAFKYVDNGIKTSHYTWYNFLFINLWEQFHRVVNVYFIFLLVLTFIPAISSFNPVTTLIPILIVLAITAVKDAVDDFHRHQSDNSINNRNSQVLKSGKVVKEHWSNLHVGDIIQIRNNEHLPADVLLLSSSGEHNIVYIETAELDGETNLKVRQALTETGGLGHDLNSLSNFKGKIECEAPNNLLHKFTGNLELNNETIPIDNEKILLRGCNLRNTDWCFGLVIFTGSDTKLMQNTGRRILKRTRIERFMNKLVWLIFAALFSLATLCAILNSVWESDIGVKFQDYMPWESYAQDPQMSGFLMFWSYIISLNTLVPISLYVSVEFIRLTQSYFIDWDRLMYYKKKNLPAIARTTTLNEELGQVEYIFSDKTGTLTQNVMKFNKCSIAGKRYGDIFNSEGMMVMDDETLPTVDLSYNDYAEPTFRFHDQTLVNKITSGHKSCEEFFRLLSICHSVMIEETDSDSLLYRAQSPDEAALVSAARNFGLVYKSKKYDSLTIIEMGKPVEYKIMAMLDFDNVRKRMSVIVKNTDDKLVLYCKGADSAILQRLSHNCDQNLVSKTERHLDSFAREGLRTLCLAKKEISADEYDVWKEAHFKASTALEDREDKLSAVYEEIERDLDLLGATAIEDKLQDGVPETIANLSNANIKIWVLTGDKQETAVNIGYSCNMLTEEMKNVFVISKHEEEEVENEIENALKKIHSLGVTNPSFVDNEQLGQEQTVPVKENQISAESNKVFGSNGLVINGHSLVHALHEDLKHKFLELATHCSAVICCRATPIQKARVVELVKKNKKAVTLAIGDGANDVSMIKAAHIGVGISGEEGTQAVLSADFAFGQFRYLERLLLVHGRWSYMRICKFLNYFFYKNFAFTLVQFWYAFFNGYTAQSVYDDWYVTLYNTVYTALPVIFLAILDQDLNDQICVKFPKLYLTGQNNELFNWARFIRSSIKGLLVSLATFFITYGALYQSVGWNGMDTADHQFVATTLATVMIAVVSFQVAIDTQYWTILNHYFTWGSLLALFPFQFVLCSDGLYNLITSQFPFAGSTRTAYSMPSLWFVVLLVTVTCILPVIFLRVVMCAFWPTYAQKVQQMDHKKLFTADSRNGHYGSIKKPRSESQQTPF